jgi:hypothetical protein
MSNSGELLSLIGRHGGIADTVAVPTLEPDQVWARESDGQGDWIIDLIPTPGSTNTPLVRPMGLVANEFLALNNTIIMDEGGEFEDWIEIFNPTSDTIPLAGVYLTDDFSRTTRWAFPDTVIYPGQFVLVWCDNEAWEGSMHASFKLSGDGEQVGLFDRDGETPIDTLSFGAQQPDISYGRYPDGGNIWYFCDPTPGDGNVGVIIHEQTPDLPTEFLLEQNYPNPFNAETIIRFALPYNAYVKLTIFDVLGREITKLLDSTLKAGYHRVYFDGIDLSSGIYICRFETEQYATSIKLVLLK